MVGDDGRRFLAGSLSGFSVRLLTQPFDVLKIRFQLQVEPIKRLSPASYYSSLPQAFCRIFREEGIYGLWKGHVPGQLLSVTFCGVEFAVFYGLKALSATSFGYLQTHVHRDLIYGTVAGTIAMTLCQPLDVMRTRLVAQGQKRVYSGLVMGLLELVRNEGVLALWRGLGPSCVLIVPQTAVTFAAYEQLKRTYQNHIGSITRSSVNVSSPDLKDSLPRWASLIAGSVSGLIAKTAVYPLDLIKKRLAVRGFEEARRCFGQVPDSYTAASYRLSNLRRVPTQFYATLACFHGILVQEGLIGLFKGWTPSACKAMLSTGLTFLFFEQYLQLLENLS
ncbi:Mitochondrial thiamine pyrophosphate carrier [Clonorchis sinensis]|uniref:Mitochondrial thiamine pyrophosphate carrier n=2 Tax=Clonorchis sinensis TaxID=79923 RepID=G7Y465_CLOSI|nr:Mitochondrial thiamine pyrophosphate carrier [Clonorchis sinensis]GAA47751.1 mitochondrial thiamine pyrophosphate carrier [Clonorchis sinensis]